MERYSDRAIEIINELHRERLDYQSEYLPLIDAANKLLAYEDTGLEPEQVMQTIDPESLRPHGKWARVKGDSGGQVGYRCSCCGSKWPIYVQFFVYCPYCGAKMEVENHDET